MTELVHVDDLVDAATIDGVLAHHGIKGMKWGIRRERGPGGTVSSNPSAKKGGVSHLSDTELRELVGRMQLEKTFHSLSSEDQSKADGFVKGLLKDIGKSQVRRVAKGAADIAIEQAIKQVGVKTESQQIQELARRIKPKKK